MQNTRHLERSINQKYNTGIADFSGNPKVLIPGEAAGDAECLAEIERMKTEAVVVRDLLDEMLLELMLVRDPSLKKQASQIDEIFTGYKAAYLKGKTHDLAGCWVLYAKGVLIHMLLPEEHYELRTSRNIGLLTREEQTVFSKAHIAVGGLSVGGLCATTLAMEGVNSFYVTDFDQLATSNLNRIGSSLAHVGAYKTDIVAEKIWDIDPFARVETNREGFTDESIDTMFPPSRLPNVVIDAMDSMEAKIRIREVCRQYRIPLVWMIDMGDGVVQIGTERYDLDDKYPAFHGNLEKMEAFTGRKLDYVESCFSIFNADYLPWRMADSFAKACNNEHAGISQLAGTVSIAAGAISRVVRKILLGETVAPEFFVEIDRNADPDFESKRQADREATHAMMADFGLR